MHKRHQDDVRAKIQSSLLIKRLQDFTAGEIELTSTQVQAIKILLDKSVSNAPTDVNASVGVSVIQLPQSDTGVL